jgi:hypothetical protein
LPENLRVPVRALKAGNDSHFGPEIRAVLSAFPISLASCYLAAFRGEPPSSL